MWDNLFVKSKVFENQKKIFENWKISYLWWKWGRPVRRAGEGQRIDLELIWNWLVIDWRWARIWFKIDLKLTQNWLEIDLKLTRNWLEIDIKLTWNVFGRQCRNKLGYYWLNILRERIALIKVMKCKSDVLLLKWILVEKNVFISLCEISPKGGGPCLKIKNVLF